MFTRNEVRPDVAMSLNWASRSRLAAAGTSLRLVSAAVMWPSPRERATRRDKPVPDSSAVLFTDSRRSTGPSPDRPIQTPCPEPSRSSLAPRRSRIQTARQLLSDLSLERTGTVPSSDEPLICLFAQLAPRVGLSVSTFKLKVPSAILPNADGHPLAAMLVERPLEVDLAAVLGRRVDWVPLHGDLSSGPGLPPFGRRPSARPLPSQGTAGGAASSCCTTNPIRARCGSTFCVLVQFGLDHVQGLQDLLSNLSAEANLRGIVQAHGLARLGVVDGPFRLFLAEVVLGGLGTIG